MKLRIVSCLLASAFLFAAVLQAQSNLPTIKPLSNPSNPFENSLVQPSAPFQFIPWLMAARSKAGEARAVEQLTNYLVERPPSLANPPEGSKIEREPSVPQKEREPFRRASPSGV